MVKQEEIAVIIDDAAFLPIYATQQAAGADLRARIEADLLLEPGATAIIPTGVRLQIPAGYEVQIRPRSGLAAKHGVTVLNTPGTIDSDYRGEVCVILINHGKIPFIIEPKMRIAQMVLHEYTQAIFCTREEIASSGRGESRFGSTGNH